MTSRWIDSDAAADTLNTGGTASPIAAGPDMVARIYSARLIGSDPSLVLHGGGNVSVKGTFANVFGETVPALFVKASGRDLATLTPQDLCPIDLSRASSMRHLDDLDDDALTNAMRLCLLDSRMPTPSIETPMHAWLPHKFVDHSHADAITAITNRKNGMSLIRKVLGDRVAIVPYIRPGLALAKAAAEAYEAAPNIEGIVLMNHGLVTFSDNAKTSYERHMALTDACESFIAKHTTHQGTISFTSTDTPQKLTIDIAPKLRGLLALPTGDADQPFERPIIEWRAGDALMQIINSNLAESFANSGPLTGDHVIRTKTRYAYVTSPDFSNNTVLDQQLEETIERFSAAYKAHLGGDEAASNDCLPTVILILGVGMFARGRTIGDARIAADIAEQTLLTKAASNGLGPFVAISEDHLRDMEQRPLQQAKTRRKPKDALTGQIVVVSGGAGAIGRAVGEACASAGAHVALTDIDKDGLARAVSRINEACGTERAIGVMMDVTNEQSVSDGYEEIVRQYGGVDVIVPNAGVAHVAPIETLGLADFQRVMSINASGYFLLMREGIRILKRQGIGGSIVINASKNVFAPGKSFGAYSASKAAGHQLGKVAAIELAQDNIRVNMINADAIFGDEETASGLWKQVGPDRAKARGLATKDLPDFYRQRNLLRARVTGRHVGQAVVFFASNATPTTGATLPVDGGVVDAFPR